MLCWTTDPLATFRWRALKWCSPDMFPHTSLHTIFPQVGLLASQKKLKSTSGLFVIVSWISFLIPMDVIPGRMALLVTLFLVLVNIFNNVTTNTPKAEGLTAIEAWMLACILFVFGALVE